jgi:hypothetical protein
MAVKNSGLFGVVTAMMHGSHANNTCIIQRMDDTVTPHHLHLPPTPPVTDARHIAKFVQTSTLPKFKCHMARKTLIETTDFVCHDVIYSDDIISGDDMADVSAAP